MIKLPIGKGETITGITHSDGIISVYCTINKSTNKFKPNDLLSKEEALAVHKSSTDPDVVFTFEDIEIAVNFYNSFFKIETEERTARLIKVRESHSLWHLCSAT